MVGSVSAHRSSPIQWPSLSGIGWGGLWGTFTFGRRHLNATWTRPYDSGLVSDELHSPELEGGEKGNVHDVVGCWLFEAQ